MKISKAHRDLLREFPGTEKFFREKSGNMVFLGQDGKDYFMVLTDKSAYDHQVILFENRADYYGHMEDYEKNNLWKEIE